MLKTSMGSGGLVYGATTTFSMLLFNTSSFLYISKFKGVQVENRVCFRGCFYKWGIYIFLLACFPPAYLLFAGILKM